MLATERAPSLFHLFIQRTRGSLVWQSVKRKRAVNTLTCSHRFASCRVVPRPWYSANSCTCGSMPALLICSYSTATCWNLTESEVLAADRHPANLNFRFSNGLQLQLATRAVGTGYSKYLGPASVCVACLIWANASESRDPGGGIPGGAHKSHACKLMRASWR